MRLRRGGGANPVEQGHAVGARHSEVRDDQVEALFLEESPSFVSVPRSPYPVAALLELGTHEIPGRTLVVHNQNQRRYLGHRSQ